MFRQKSHQFIKFFTVFFLIPVVFSSIVFPSGNSFFSSHLEINDTDITVINIQSYPIVGGQWIVRFSTIGTADLTISAINGTTWRDNESTNDLEFQSIKKGNTTLEYEWIEKSIIIRNFSSNEICYEVSKIFSQGKHTLMFRFGNDVAYANNDATNWWDSDWGCRKLITINSSQVSSNLSNFPILVNITDIDLRDDAQEDGDDITFVLWDDNSTKLNHEIELFNKTTGEIVVWINVTNLSSTVDRKIWMYYNNSVCSNQQNINDVWDSNYVMVHHLNETSQTTGNYNDHFDSTLYNNNGETYNGATMDIDGKVDGGDEFSGNTSDDYIAIEDNLVLDITDEISISFWVNLNDYANTSDLVTKGSYLDSYSTWVRSTGTVRFAVNDDYLTSADSLNINTWYYLTFTRDSSTNGRKIYINGIENANDTLSTSFNTNNDPLYISTNYYEIDGVIDEVRISNIARTSSWIKTCYNNMNGPDKFIEFGNESHVTDTSVNAIIPYKTSNPSISIIATGHNDLDNVTLWYRYSLDNSIWSRWMENETDYIGGDSWTWSFNFTKRNNTGFYEFYSVGKKNGCADEVEPTVSTLADAMVWATPYAPSITGENPTNGSTDKILVPTLNVTVEDLNDNYLNATWYSNSSGTWIQFGTNQNIDVSGGPVSISQENLNFSDYSTYYWWSVNISDGNAWTNETYTFNTRQNVAPVINTYDIKNISGNSKKDNNTGLITNNNEYYFTINITEQNGWFDIRYIDIKAWYDKGNDGATYNETLGGNINMFLRYENTSGNSNYFLIWPDDEAELILANCTESIINETTRIVNISFKPKNQVRWANSNQTWTETDDAFGDPYSWNFEVDVNDTGDLNDNKKGEYGVDFYSCISVAPLLVEITSAPGFNDTSEIFTITYSSNYDYHMIIFLEENLTHTECEETILVKDNLIILENADLGDDITENTTFAGIGEDHAIYIFNTSGIYPKNNISQDVDVQFRMYIPLGTISGTYSANIATKTTQKLN